MEPGKDETTTKENYKNGDIYWNTYTGVFKAYDKDGNEVKFPTDDLSYEVKFEDVEKGKTMTEIEKLYSLVEVEAKIKCKSSQCTVTNPRPDWCNKCESLSKTYPPFTAEKQIELIKWCLDNYRGYIFDDIETEFFKEQLCAFINDVWQDLTEAEQNEIKRILE